VLAPPAEQAVEDPRSAKASSSVGDVAPAGPLQGPDKGQGGSAGDARVATAAAAAVVEAEDEVTVQKPKGSNLLSTIRSFLPSKNRTPMSPSIAAGKKAVSVSHWVAPLTSSVLLLYCTRTFHSS
jgi:hypothetical protein